MKNGLQARSQYSCSDIETAHPTATYPSFISNENSGKEGQQNIALIPNMRMWRLQLTCRILGELGSRLSRKQSTVATTSSVFNNHSLKKS